MSTEHNDTPAVIADAQQIIARAHQECDTMEEVVRWIALGWARERAIPHLITVRGRCPEDDMRGVITISGTPESGAHNEH